MKLSDSELNLAIARLVYPDAIRFSKTSCGTRVMFSINKGLSVDYLNNWNDLMNLVVKQNFDYEVLQVTKGWRAVAAYTDTVFESVAKTQQRALAECLYLVLLEKEKSDA